MSHPVCACQTPPEAHASAKHVVTLVHGTFARHGDWIQDGQKLTNALHMTGPDTVLDRFCWSGKNRHTHRLEAGDALRAHLVALIKDYEAAGAQADHHVIAHSHGGNVALYALRARGDEDDALLAGVNVIALATPFLFMRERVTSRWLFAILPVYFLIMVLNAATAYGVSQVGFIVFSALAAVAFLGIIAFPLSISLYGRRGSTPPVRDLVSGRATFAESHRITVPDLPADRILVIRGLGDEASGSLIGAQMMNWIMTKLIGRFRNWPALLFWTFIISMVIAFMLGLFGVDDHYFDSVFDAMFDTLFIAFIVVPLIVLPVVAAFIALANVVFGADSLFWNYYAQTTAEHSPRGLSNVIIVGTRQFRYDALSHSVYEDSEAIDAMVNRVAPVIQTEAATG